MAVCFSRAEHGWRRLAGRALLALWAGWMLAVFTTMSPPMRAGAPVPDEALAALHAALPPELEATGPLAVRLPGPCTCRGDEVGWSRLADTMTAHHGTSLTLDSPPPALANAAVVILGADGQLRYAGPLQPDPTLCGVDRGPGRLARWLPSLLAASTPLLLPAPGCAR